MLPDIIGRRYILQNEIGRGGMGTVYRAADRLTGKVVALKRVITGPFEPGFSSSHNLSDFRLSLAREFKLAVSLRHPNIIEVLDYGFDHEREPYYTMELLQGAQTILQAGFGKPLRYKMELFAQMLQSLAYLHRRGILHRDIKPANVLVIDNQVKLLDFGLSAMRERAQQPAEESDTTAGTMAYMAPEIMIGHSASEESDLYAAGVIAYEMIASHHPFNIEDIGMLVNQVLSEMPDVSSLGVSPKLTIIISRLLEKEPENRYHSAVEVIKALDDAFDHSLEVDTAAARESFLQAARLVGRETELEQLAASLKQAVKGDGGAWLLAGESGVGKSRLVEEIRTRAMVSGALVMSGQAVNSVGTSYQMWRSVFGWLTLLDDLAPDDLILIKSQLPDVPTLTDVVVPPDYRVDPQVAQNRLLTLLRDAAIRHDLPFVLVFEDLHWAGSASLSLLAQFYTQIADLPVLIIASYRDDERPDLPSFLPGMKVMRLNRLGEAGIAELSRAMLGEAGVQPQVVDLLKRETEGNVFFIIEVIRALAEEAGQLEQIGMMTVPQHIFSGGVWKLIQHRLSQIPQYAQYQLQIAAVTGREVDLNLLRYLAPTIDLERWLTDCANAAVLEIMDGQWRFAHDKLREGVLEGLTEENRRLMHRQVAQALESLYGDSAERLAALAHHWHEAGNTDKERHYVALAGAQAVRTGAYREAIRYLERALKLMPAPSVALLHQLAEAHLGIGGYDQAEQLYSDSLKLAATPADRASTISRLGDVGYARGQYQRAETYYQEALTLFQLLDDTASIARTYNSLGNVAYETGDSSGARQYYQQSISLVRESGGQWSMAGSLRNAENDATVRDTQEHQYLLDELQKHLKEGNKRAAAETLYHLGVACVERSEYEQARQYYQRGAALAQESGDSSGLALVLNANGGLALVQKQFEDAGRSFMAALEAAHNANNDLLTLQILVNFARLYSARGDQPQALEMLAFVLYSPECPEGLQDEAERFAFDLQTGISPRALDGVWERGKSRQLDEIITELRGAFN